MRKQTLNTSHHEQHRAHGSYTAATGDKTEQQAKAMVQSTQGSVSLPGVGQSTQQTYTAATGDGVASRQLNDGGHDFSEGLLDLHHHSSTRQLLGPVNTQSTQQSVAL